MYLKKKKMVKQETKDEENEEFTNWPPANEAKTWLAHGCTVGEPGIVGLAIRLSQRVRSNPNAEIKPSRTQTEAPTESSCEK